MVHSDSGVPSKVKARILFCPHRTSVNLENLRERSGESEVVIPVKGTSLQHDNHPFW